MAELRICGIMSCEKDAVIVVKYFQDGSGAVAACGQHTVKAIEQVSEKASLFGTESLSIRPVGAMSSRIQRKRFAR